MHYRLELSLRRAEGALARVLGTAERRGYRPIAIHGETQSEGACWCLRLTVEGERSGAALQAQLAKLHGCLAVTVSPYA